MNGSVSSPLSVWHCTLGEISDSGLTVGTPFSLACEGPSVEGPEGFDTQSLSLELEKNDQFRLRILETKQASSTQVQLVVSSYVAGKNNIVNSILTDGKHRVGLGPIQFEVQSVIEQAETQPTPFPASEAETLSWPLWVPIAVASLVVCLFLALFWVRRRRKRKEDFLKWLADNRTVLSPYDQLNKDLRKAARERDPGAYLQELERATRWYLARRLESPLLTAPAKEVTRALSVRVRSKDLPSTTNQLLSEFKRLGVSIADIKTEVDRDEALNKTLPAVSELVREFSNQVENGMSAKPGRSRSEI